MTSRRLARPTSLLGWAKVHSAVAQVERATWARHEGRLCASYEERRYEHRRAAPRVDLDDVRARTAGSAAGLRQHSLHQTQPRQARITIGYVDIEGDPRLRAACKRL